MKTRNRLVRTSAAAIAIGGLWTAGLAYAEDSASAGNGASTLTVIEQVRPDALPVDPLDSKFGAQLDLAIRTLPDSQREVVRAFYADRLDAPFWIAPEHHADLLSAIAGSGAHGIPASRYADLALPENVDDPLASAGFEIAAMRTYLGFAGDLGAGILEPARVDPEINIKPRRPSTGELLARLDGGDVTAALDASVPQDPDYARLLEEKLRLDGVINDGGWGATVPEGPTLRAGESDPRVPLLRARLARLGYSAAVDADLGPAAFDPVLSAALERFQSDHGLVDDGVFGARTREALNVSAESRLRQVVVNLERMRWVNPDPEGRHIAVNIPDYSVEMVDGGTVVWKSRAVVGEDIKTRTPEFSDSMTHFVVNPTWHIPDSIATRVYLPKLSRDPAVLERSNMSLFTRSGVEINPRLVNFTQYSAANFPFRIKQNPSAANALGRVKFMFPNQFAIYLHDTPSRDLFSKDRRAFSNGCVRLERPIELSHVLLDGQVPDPADAMQSWLASGKETYVNLDRPVPVHILYRTVVVDENGTPRYRADVYGRDRKVFEALSEQGLELTALQG